MTNAVERFEEIRTSFIQAIEKFARSLAELGPHPIPKSRRLVNQIHDIHSIKAGHTEVVCESPLEADVVLWGESRPDVVGIQTQPLRIHGAIGNKPYHTLDVCFDFDDGRKVYYEVKPSKHIKVHEDGSRGPANWPFIKAWGKANGVDVDYITEEALIGQRQCIENWRTMLPFASISYERPDPDLEKAIYQLVKAGRAFTIFQIEDCHPTIDNEEIYAHVAKLIHKGLLKANVNSIPASPSMEVWVDEDEASDDA